MSTLINTEGPKNRYSHCKLQSAGWKGEKDFISVGRHNWPYEKYLVRVRLCKVQNHLLLFSGLRVGSVEAGREASPDRHPVRFPSLGGAAVPRLLPGGLLGGFGGEVLLFPPLSGRRRQGQARREQGQIKVQGGKGRRRRRGQPLRAGGRGRGEREVPPIGAKGRNSREAIVQVFMVLLRFCVRCHPGFLKRFWKAGSVVAGERELLIFCRPVLFFASFANVAIMISF